MKVHSRLPRAALATVAALLVSIQLASCALGSPRARFVPTDLAKRPVESLVAIEFGEGTPQGHFSIDGATLVLGEEFYHHPGATVYLEPGEHAFEYLGEGVEAMTDVSTLPPAVGKAVLQQMESAYPGSSRRAEEAAEFAASQNAASKTKVGNVGGVPVLQRTTYHSSTSVRLKMQPAKRGIVELEAGRTTIHTILDQLEDAGIVHSFRGSRLD